MDEEIKETIKAALRIADHYYEEIVAEMQEAYVNALRYGVDYEFDDKLLGKFEWAIENLATAAACPIAEGIPIPEDLLQKKAHDI